MAFAKSQPVGIAPRRCTPGCTCQQEESDPTHDEVRELALRIRKGLKDVIAGIDELYGESNRDRKRRERERAA